MRTADSLLDEIVLNVAPPPNVAIILRERVNDFPDRPNWRATVARMPATQANRFSSVVSVFERSLPRVDWSAVETKYGGVRWIARTLADVTSRGETQT